MVRTRPEAYFFLFPLIFLFFPPQFPLSFSSLYPYYPYSSLYPFCLIPYIFLFLLPLFTLFLIYSSFYFFPLSLIFFSLFPYFSLSSLFSPFYSCLSLPLFFFYFKKVSWCSWLSHHLDVVRVPGSNPGGTILFSPNLSSVLFIFISLFPFRTPLLFSYPTLYLSVFFSIISFLFSLSLVRFCSSAGSSVRLKI